MSKKILVVIADSDITSAKKAFSGIIDFEFDFCKSYKEANEKLQNSCGVILNKKIPYTEEILLKVEFPKSEKSIAESVYVGSHGYHLLFSAKKMKIPAVLVNGGEKEFGITIPKENPEDISTLTRVLTGYESVGCTWKDYRDLWQHIHLIETKTEWYSGISRDSVQAYETAWQKLKGESTLM